MRRGDAPSGIVLREDMGGPRPPAAPGSLSVVEAPSVASLEVLRPGAHVLQPARRNGGDLQALPRTGSRTGPRRGWWPMVMGMLGSLPAAVGVLAGLGVVVALGGVVEAQFGPGRAHAVVYRTWWFAVLQGFLGLNVACAAVRRYPWRPRHTGFVLTHVGIIVVLLGAAIGSWWGVEGQLVLVEGGPAKSMFALREEVVEIAPAGTAAARGAVLPVAVGTSREPARDLASQGLPLRAWVATRLAHSRVQWVAAERASAGPGGPAPGPIALGPAIEVATTSRAMGITGRRWLIASSPQGRRWGVGPLLVKFWQVPGAVFDAILNAAGDDTASHGRLLIAVGDTWASFPISDKSGQRWRLEGSGTTVTVVRYFPDLVLRAGRPVSRSRMPINPAVLYRVESRGATEVAVLAARQLDWSAGYPHDARGRAVRPACYVFPSAGRGRWNELTVLRDEDGRVGYTLVGRDGSWAAGHAEVGEPIATPWLDLRLTITAVRPEMVVIPRLRRAVSLGGPAVPVPAVRLVLEGRDGARGVQDLRWEDEARVAVGGDSFTVRYGWAERPLGFRLALEAFRTVHDPGTGVPAQYTSRVRLVDEARGVQRVREIRPNHPLSYGGYRFFQAGSRDTDPVQSLLLVTRDPGWGLKWGGAAVIVCGMVTMMFGLPGRGRALRYVRG